MLNLYKEVYRLVAQVPKGKVTTYGAIARALGDLRASRTIGRMLNENPKPFVIPCHRVVESTGKLGGYKFGTAKKATILASEGIMVKDGKIENFKELLFMDFRTDYPLQKLRALQEKLASKVVIEDSFEKLGSVAGVDITYKDKLGIACGVVLDYDTGKLLEIKTIKKEIIFPYIPTYLAFRELPIIEKLLEHLKNPDILMIDGNGILHPFGMGIASHAGITLNLPTIGVAKKLLCGEVETLQEKALVSRIFYKNRHVGFCLRSATKPVYLSPGHLVSLETSLKVVKKFCKFRVPEPIRLAHELGRKIFDTL